MPVFDKLKKLKDNGHVHQCACGCGDDSCVDTDCSPEYIQEEYHAFNTILVVRLVASIILFALGLILKLPEYATILILIASTLIAGYDVLLGAFVNLLNKQVFDENLLMTIAAIAAFLIGESHEGAAVIILFQVGELFQNFAVGRTKRSVEELMDLRPDSATVIIDGEESIVQAESVEVGMTIVIRPGERIPLDSTVIEGNSVLDMSALTGESIPKAVSKDDILLSGAVNLSAPIKAKVTSIATESTAARILALVQAESAQKGKTEKFITKFARIYTPIVVIVAVLIAAIMGFGFDYTLKESLRRALVFLVISCPCALVISVPLTYFAGIGGASKIGVLFKSSAAMDAVAKTKAIVFDKTGTLTTGVFKVTEVKPEKIDRDTLLKVAAHAEAYSNHPIAKSIVSAYGQEISYDLLKEYTEYPGKGISVLVSGIKIIIGNREFLMEQGTEFKTDENADLAIYVSVGGAYAGCLILQDTVKEDSATAIQQLATLGCERVVMLTGDNRDISSRLANSLGIREYYSECLPVDKVNKVKELKTKVSADSTVVFVGDGINDAPVLTAADIGIAMGALGSDAAVEAADVVIMDDRPTKVVTAVKLSKATIKIVYQNIVLALSVKLIIMVLGLVGISTLWFAVVADVGVALAAILNSMRAFNASESI